VAWARRPQIVAWVLLAPATIYLLILFVAPLVQVLVLSFTDPKVSIAHFLRVFTAPLYLRTLGVTFQTAFTVTVVCLLLAYPLAYVMARTKGKLAIILLAIVGISFWTSFLVRTYSWLVIFGNRGPIAAIYELMGWGEMPRLLFTQFASTLGMTHLMLPYMVMALYAIMSRIEDNYVRAAHSLGATPFAAFRTVYFPLSLPGVINGSLLVFAIVMGFYVTPQLLGSPQARMISQLIAEQVNDLLAWGFASALAVVLLVATSIVIGVYNRVAGIDRLWGD
jgi:putative spermidine/putrescine transport system permease protein